MVQKGFSHLYSMPLQHEFLLALKRDDFVAAMRTLSAIPRGNGNYDQIRYFKTMQEGYEMIAKAMEPRIAGYLKTIENQDKLIREDAVDIRSLRKQEEDLQAYKNIGSLGEIREIMAQVKKLGGTDSINQRLEKLGELEREAQETARILS